MIPTRYTISIIAAISSNNVIGNENKLPWAGKIKSDMHRFRKLTSGHTIIMGRKTFESIGRSLPDRFNIILSKNKEFSAPGCLVVDSFKEALAQAQKMMLGQIFVIGGAEIYQLALPFTDRIYLTLLHKSFSGDTYFPAFDATDWRVVESKEFAASSEGQIAYTFQILQRKNRFVNLRHASNQNYRQTLEEIRESGVCPFCPENLTRWHHLPTLMRKGKWIITSASMQKYDNAEHRFLIIGDCHIENFEELLAYDLIEITQLVYWAVKEYGLEGYGLIVRSGNTNLTGASVSHLHFHLVVPEKDKCVNFPIG